MMDSNMDITMDLAEREKFGDIECSIYRNTGSNELFFTREQIGTALEYSEPRIAIMKIHSRHADRLNRFSTVVSLSKSGGNQFGIPQSDDGFHPEYGGTQETTLYSRKGVMEICRWSRQPKADAFMDWVWEVTDRLMRGDIVLAPGNCSGIVSTEALSEKLDVISGVLDSLNGMISKAIDNMDAKVFRPIALLDDKISKVQTASSYSNYYLRCQMRSGYDERWERSQHPRLKTIAEFIGIDERRLLQEIYIEMEHRYGITLDSFVNDYKRTKRISTCSTLSVISFSLTLREMFTAIVDEVLDICGIEIQESTQQSRLLDMAHVAVSRKFEDVTHNG